MKLLLLPYRTNIFQIKSMGERISLFPLLRVSVILWSVVLAKVCAKEHVLTATFARNTVDLQGSCHSKVNLNTMNIASDNSFESSTVKTAKGENNKVENALAIVPYEAPVLARFHDAEKEFEFGKHKVRIKQDWSGSGVAAVVWDAAIVLAEYLQKNTDLVKDRTVLELGAGTGLAGITAAKLGASKTVLTDRETALHVLQTNVQLNNPQCSQTKLSSTDDESMCSSTDDESLCCNNVLVEALEWGSEIEQKHLNYDLILGADIIYIEETFDLLLKTLLDLTSVKKQYVVILLSCRIRYERDEKFLNMLREHFGVKQEFYDETRDIYIYRVVYKDTTR